MMEDVADDKFVEPISPPPERDFESSLQQTPRDPRDANLSKQDTHRDDDPENLTIALSTHSHLKPPSSLPQEIFFVIVVCMAQFFTQAGLSLSIPTAHIIGDSFSNTNSGQLSWFAAAYSLTVGTFILVAGRLGDLFGHKLLFILGFCWFGVWCILGGFSVWSNATFFIACRAFQGIGAGLFLPNAIAILGRTYPPGRRKELVFSLFGATAPGGFILGSVFAALISERGWWPWVYWVMGMVCLVFAFLGLLAIPHTPVPKHPDQLSLMTRVDVPGAVAGISGLVLINFAWNQAPIVGWTDPYTYIVLIIGFLCLGAFGFIERKVSCPLLPASIFSGDVAWALSCIAAGWSSFGIAQYYWYQIMEVIKGDSPLLAAGKWAAAPVMGVVAGLSTAYLLSRVSPSVIMFCALSGFTIGSCLMATIPMNQTYWAQAFVLTVIYPFGMDMSFPAGTILVSNAMHHRHQGIAASLVATVVNYSISLGLGFAGTIETNVNDNGHDLLRGYHGALYCSVGLAGVGLMISVLYMFVSWSRSRNTSPVRKQTEETRSVEGKE